MNIEAWNGVIAYMLLSNFCVGFVIWFGSRAYYREVMKAVNANGIAEGVELGLKLEQAGFSKPVQKAKKKK